MSEATHTCAKCLKQKPLACFIRPNGDEALFLRCDTCREKSRNYHRAYRKRVKSGPQLVVNANNDLSNSATRKPDAATVPVSNQLSQSLSSDLDNKPHLSVTIAPGVVISSTNETTSTTVITITTTVKHVNDLGKDPSSEINTQAEQTLQEANNCELDSVSDDFSSERESSSEDSSVDKKVAPGSGFFWCIHCERCRPAPLQAMSVCLFCVRDWKWCEKGSHNRPKADFMWQGNEHDECIHCVMDTNAI